MILFRGHVVLGPDCCENELKTLDIEPSTERNRAEVSILLQSLQIHTCTLAVKGSVWSVEVSQSEHHLSLRTSWAVYFTMEHLLSMYHAKGCRNLLYPSLGSGYTGPFRILF